MSTICRVTSVVAWLVLTATAASAQTVYNPTWLEFASPDHAQAGNYVVEYWLDGVDPATGAPFTTTSLAKAAMTANGTVYTAPLSALVPLPAPQVGKTYRVTVQAVGVDPSVKSPRSGLSNPFAIAPVPATPSGVLIR